MDKLLEIKNLHARIGEKEILKGIDLSIGRGEIHAVMGPNCRWRLKSAAGRASS